MVEISDRIRPFTHAVQSIFDERLFLSDESSNFGDEKSCFLKSIGIEVLKSIAEMEIED